MEERFRLDRLLLTLLLNETTNPISVLVFVICFELSFNRDQGSFYLITMDGITILNI